MRIFITGASGFVGGAATRELLKNNEVLAMARSEKSSKAIKEMGATPVNCELGKVQESDLQGCDTIIHCAAFVEEWGSPKEFWQINVEGTSQLLEVARKAKVKRFIHIGTEAALFYGQHLRNIDETYPYPKKTPILYSKTKAEAEKRVLAANDPQKDFTTISLRPRLIWGPGDNTVLPVVKEMVQTGKFMWINQGNIKTSTVFINNLIYAISQALTKGKGGETYFITDDQIVTFRDFLTRMMQTQKIQMPKKSVPSWFVRTMAFIIEKTWRIFGVKAKPPVTRHAAYVMSSDCTLKIDKAKKDLEYSPLVSIEQGLAIMEKSCS